MTEKQIWKYPLKKPVSNVSMPFDAQVLFVHGKDDLPTLWALVDPKAETVIRTFEVYATGEAIVFDNGSNRVYLGSALLIGNSLVYHVFENNGI